MSTVDVIVPCYRYGRYLTECVDSVLRQREVDVRLLIIDDASPDDSPQVATVLASSDQRIHVIKHAQNKGHIQTYNEGIEWASAKYMLLLSADDYLLPGALARAVSLMERHPDVGMTFGKAIEWFDSGATASRPEVGAPSGAYQVLNGAAFVDASGIRNLVPTATAVVRTELQKALGGYRSDLPHSGDMEMWLRFAAYSSVGMVEAYQAVRRLHGNNMSIAYAALQHWSDFLQRKAAVDFFLSQHAQRIDSEAILKLRMQSLLARDAIGIASAAFNDRQAELMHTAIQLAVVLDRGVWWTRPGIRFAAKRRLGHRLCTLLQRLRSEPV